MPRAERRPWLVAAALVATVAACTDGAGDADPTTTAPTASAASTTSTTTTTVPPEPSTTTVPALPDHRRGAALPVPRTEVAGAVWEGRIVVVGGLVASGDASPSVDVYDPVSDEWDSLPDLPQGLHHTAVAVLGDRLYVVGGYAIEANLWVQQAEVWTLGPGEDAWEPGPPLQIPRGALAVASTGDRLVAIGGTGPPGSLTSTELLEAGSGAWVSGPAMADPREHLAATAVGDEVYAIAGRVAEMGTNTTSVEVLRDGRWQPAPSLNHSRSGIGAAVVGGVPCVAGGEEHIGTIGSVECLVDGAWQVVARLEAPRHGLAVVAFDGWLHVIGGGPTPGLTVSGIHEIFSVDMP